MLSRAMPLLAFALLGVSPTLGRRPSGTIAGHVRDPGGAVIANASVMILGTTLHTATDHSGAYRFDHVPIGTYRVRAAFVGYTPSAVPGVRVLEGRTAVVDIVLQPSTQQVAEMVVAPAAKAMAVRDQIGSNVTVRGYIRGDEPWRRRHEAWNTEEYGHTEENRFLAVAAHPLSTFSVDVDRASYSNVRRFLMQGQTPSPDAVRIEELVNYFPYGYAGPEGDAPLAIHTELGPAPWKPAHRLLHVGLQARRIDTRGLPPSNLVFLIDVSGSMDMANKLPLLKSSLALLINTLRPQDRVAIVVYAGSAGLVLPSTPGDQKATMLAAIDRLSAGGSTAGGAGIKRAYDEAVANFIRGGNNRVILATDGDFNVGVSSDGELVRLIEDKRMSGVFLTVLGFGEGNLKDSKMEQLADHGNGNYAYIDTLLEAKKTLVHELGGTLFTVAKDVKIQIEFNPAHVRAYRLIGYENRLLADEDFADDTKDAGEIGSGHSVTALYEIIPVGVETDVDVRVPDSLRYQSPRAPRTGGPELGFVKVRYKAPDGDRSRMITHRVLDTETRAPTGDFRFQSAVAELGLLLRGSSYRGSASFEDVIARARASLGADRDGYRAEFVRLAEAAQSLGLARADTAH